MVLNNELREKQLKRIKNVLMRGLKKKVLISNTTFDEHDDNIGEVLEGNLSYDVDILANALLSIIEAVGDKVKFSNGAIVRNRTICLGSEVSKTNIDAQEDTEREIIYYNYLVYPDVVESFLNDLENLDNGFEPKGNNSILVGFEDNRKYVDYIDFSNCYDIDTVDINNSYLLKYVFGLVKLSNIKKYDDNDSNLIDRIDYNDFVLGFLRKVTNTTEISLLNQTVKKGKVKKKKLNE